MTDFRIRVAEGRDVVSIREIATAGWYSTYASVIPDELIERFLNEAYGTEHLIDSIESQSDSLLVIEEDTNRAIGFIHAVMRDDGRSAEIVRLYVRPKQTRRGFGKRLLAACLDVLRQKFSAEIAIVRVHTHNTDAIRFYEREGFSALMQVEERLYDRMIPLLHMVKRLHNNK